uniref:uncharacterized protein LOC109972556 n=1 Tax=Monopterus albus TaxID=43700 RepID=UPI0009B48D14|nr:uncharacterized protein LOC109972556 [Monopterus albus]XP_020477163.1 uncharacterized protein LOC109972556 [Monopterus albus]XP_020477164.1 uncharacterized protein LOC109972556 [Monopterus albus]XP_020477165.1 uncharacterized protein LOC109972556 [Monopterus albus]XP_020477166.1 uncharacterized protein LOC109972556 [Monopterus albus]XP_020477167.1 uncharacterized protein LOC109972556 [Monopterus albus]XP_020477168.1 uncharacterized protein LOC109972556 [Monopterus albus]XP_020477169.1 unc
MMAESSLEPAAASDLLIDQTLCTETVSKEPMVTVTADGLGSTMESDVGTQVSSSNEVRPLHAVVLKEKEEEEDTPTPPESSSLSSENGTITCITTEEESVSTLLRLIKTEGGQDGGPGLELDLEESSSVATGNGSEDRQDSTDSASFSIPSLELSDGVLATGNSLDVEDGLSSSYSALGVEGCSPSTEIPGPKDDETLEVAGGAVAGAAVLLLQPPPP